MTTTRAASLFLNYHTELEYLPRRVSALCPMITSLGIPILKDSSMLRKPYWHNFGNVNTPRVTPHRASTVSDIPGPEASISATSKPAGVAALSLLSRNTL